MRKVFKNSKRLNKKIEKLPKVYSVVLGNQFYVREFPYAGKIVYSKKYNQPLPLIYEYDDCNGACDNWYIRYIYDAKCWLLIGYFFDKGTAELFADALNEATKNKCK